MFVRRCFNGAVILMLVFLSGVTFSAEPRQEFSDKYILKIATMDLPPYGWIDEQGKKHGLVFDISEEVGKRSGMRYANEILPFSRMLKLLKDGEVDILSSQAHRNALEAGDKLAVIFKINVIAVTRKDSSINSIKDLKGKVFIYHMSASYKQLEGFPKEIYRVGNYEQAVQMLCIRKDVDAAIISEPAFYYFMQKQGRSLKDFGKIIPIERDKEQWMFVRRGIATEIRTKLKLIVEQIYRENLWEKLLSEYKKSSQ